MRGKREIKPYIIKTYNLNLTSEVGKNKKEREFFIQRPQKRGIPANFRVGRDSFFIFKKMIFLLAVFGYQFICIRITQFFRFLKVAASFICLLQLYLAKSQ